MRFCTPTCRIISNVLKLLSVFLLILTVYLFLTSLVPLAYNLHGVISTKTEMDYSSYIMFIPANPTNCTTYIRKTKEFLSKENISYACKALEEEGCQGTYNDYYEKADPLSVFLRSSTCDLEWPSMAQSHSKS